MDSPTLTPRANRLLNPRLLAYATAAGAGVLGAAGTARADFIGPYAVSNFTLTLVNSDGFVNTAAAPVSITLFGSDNQSGFPGNTDYTVAAAGTGTVSFNFNYTSVNTGNFDNFGFLRNGVYTQLANNASQGPGVFSTNVNQGDTIGFRINSLDNILGRGVVTISNFQGPQGVGAVPEPSSLALLALGAVGTVLAYRFRKQKPEA